MRNGSGVILSDGGATFQVWAPLPEKVELHLVGSSNRLIPMEKLGDYWSVTVREIGPGTQYFYKIDGQTDRPDPASRFQPEGVHGPSEIIDPNFHWTDHCWFGLPLSSYVIYELHVGAYTPEGTFEGLIPHLPALKELGITAIEIMPVAQFPGTRNWGYDGVYPYAVQNSYGGAVGFKRFVNAAHAEGLAVILDVVYNHLGPEGNYFSAYGPYFTDSYKTPWGNAINFGESNSDPVREFFLGNAENWIREFHLDGLRLDACHQIFDSSAFNILEDLAKTVAETGDELNRRVYTFAESDANDPRYIRSPEFGGHGFNCQWLDDYHHALYTALAGTGCGQYAPDYNGVPHLAKSYKEGFVYSGEYCPSRRRRHGRSSRDIVGSKFVVFIQNHDQVGNKPGGTRLASEVSFEAQKLAAGAYLLSPYIPLIFMGEEYGETAPFYFFTDHSDEELIKNIKEGRAKEFASEAGEGTLPDPQSIKIFESSKLRQGCEETAGGKILRHFYKHLLEQRKLLPPLASMNKDEIIVRLQGQHALVITRVYRNMACVIIFNFAQEAATVPFPEKGRWTLLLNSADEKWAGPEKAEHVHLEAETKHSQQVTLAPESLRLYYAVQASGVDQC